MNAERRGFVIVIVVLALSAGLGAVYGPSVRATSSNSDDYQTAVLDFARFWTWCRRIMPSRLT